MSHILTLGAAHTGVVSGWSFPQQPIRSYRYPVTMLPLRYKNVLQYRTRKKRAAFPSKFSEQNVSQSAAHFSPRAVNVTGATAKQSQSLAAIPKESPRQNDQLFDGQHLLCLWEPVPAGKQSAGTRGKERFDALGHWTSGQQYSLLSHEFALTAALNTSARGTCLAC
jgi:hypothetical protein